MKVKLNTKAVKNLLKSEEFANAVADAARARLPSGFRVETKTGHDRARAVVSPANDKARRDALNNNTLEKAFYPLRKGKRK